MSLSSFQPYKSLLGRDGSAMRKNEKMRNFFCNSSAMRCEFWFHFRIAFRTFLCMFCAFFSHFSQLFGALTVKYRPKRWKKCENAKKMRKVRCECEMRMRCEKSAMRSAFSKSANAMRKSFRTTIPAFGCSWTHANWVELKACTWSCGDQTRYASIKDRLIGDKVTWKNLTAIFRHRLLMRRCKEDCRVGATSW